MKTQFLIKNFFFLSVWDPVLTLFELGQWTVAEGEETFAMPGENYLILMSEARKHGISSKLTKPIDFNGKTLVLQYEFRIMEQMNCGGAYIKLFPSLYGESVGDENKIASNVNEFDPISMNGKTPYLAMFGPDRCGEHGHVIFIYKYRNRKSGEISEHLGFPAMIAPWLSDSPLTHLYRLEIDTVQSTWKVTINDEVLGQGSLLKELDPTIQPSKTISDPSDMKPSDWVDDPEIDDPNDKKPENYDSITAEIVDPEATRPIEWNDDLDGDWEPPTIPNPDYYGPWVPRRIQNPLYKGKWQARQIDNPHFYEETKPLLYAPVGGLGFELWSMQSGFMFDNVLLTTNVSDADVMQKIWKQKFDAESSIKADIDWKHYPPFYRRWIDNAFAFSEEQPILFVAICLLLGFPFMMWAIISTPPPKRKTESPNSANQKEKNETTSTETSATETRKDKVKLD